MATAGALSGVDPCRPPAGHARGRDAGARGRATFGSFGGAESTDRGEGPTANFFAQMPQGPVAQQSGRLDRRQSDRRPVADPRLVAAPPVVAGNSSSGRTL